MTFFDPYIRIFTLTSELAVVSLRIALPAKQLSNESIATGKRFFHSVLRTLLSRNSINVKFEIHCIFLQLFLCIDASMNPFISLIYVVMSYCPFKLIIANFPGIFENSLLDLQMSRFCLSNFCYSFFFCLYLINHQSSDFDLSKSRLVRRLYILI